MRRYCAIALLVVFVLSSSTYAQIGTYPEGYLINIQSGERLLINHFFDSWSYMYHIYNRWDLVNLSIVQIASYHSYSWDFDHWINLDIIFDPQIQPGNTNTITSYSDSLRNPNRPGWVTVPVWVYGSNGERFEGTLSQPGRQEGPIPEPASIAQAALGLVGISGFALRRRRKL